ncbi:DNA primase catalytic subunit PriS [Salinigranum halophilum]|uniref:DNA primase catalytic subunit PriS n=1 Tax=Salinigranum halophilum TaxID=2565931 RepID=UPI0010A8B4FD|nr:DNA primase catalytic subunit PriS [Salinigranum halophilum]
MDPATRDFLRRRFSAYYASTDVDLPPAAESREWGYIPWTAGGTTMVRHKALVDLGDVGTFLADEAPRHVYFSAAEYRAPGAGTMDEKGWLAADLVFDLDGDHLDGVDESTPYPEMLERCKGALVRLVDLLTDDLGFSNDDLQVVFSGGRGYHVHVREESVRTLDSTARREVVDYLRAIDLDIDGLVRTETRRGTTRRMLKTEGGWGARTHRRLLAFVDELAAMDEADATARLMELDGIGEKRARTILGAFETTPEAVRTGNLEAGGPGVRTLVESLAREVVADETAPIDEPVTTDLRRLIRFPGSLHGGTGLVVRRLPVAGIESFDPLVDAVAEPFTDREIRVEVTEPGPVQMEGDSFRVEEGVVSVRECVGVFLLARGRAEIVQS